MTDRPITRGVTRLLALALLGLASALAACEGHTLPGKPTPESVELDPRTVLSFDKLYGVNCAGCHGVRGRGGAALGLGSASYLALVSDAELRQVIVSGRPKTAMPAFAQSAGGMLSNAQVDALVAGIRAWAPAGAPKDPQMPAYAATATGNAARGATAFRAHCGACHGANGQGSNASGSIVNDSFLDLVSEQSLRTTMLAGRLDLGCPDWQHKAGTPMSDEDVTDTVAWLLSNRTRSPGQPYRSAQARVSERKP
ncbi:MAG TPA: c-type cytochrome [Polyangiaceae bacterium]